VVVASRVPGHQPPRSAARRPEVFTPISFMVTDDEAMRLAGVNGLPSALSRNCGGISCDCACEPAPT
jgi:hypothetical protein